ncbi:MAG: LPS-assembly protein LptD [Cytophagales bacterium]|nr:MAG: LPS-assembly protein LptD [Cytophagales bacterium]
MQPKTEITLNCFWLKQYGTVFLGSILLLTICSSKSYAQNPINNKITVVTDTLRTNDSVSKDTIKKERTLNTTVKYSARDSIKSNLIKKMTYLYGDAVVVYGDINLSAEEIEIDWNKNIIIARGKIDSTGKLVGVPIFKQGEEEYEAQEMTYNYKTQKGIIIGIVTKQGEGYLGGDRVKKNAENEMFLRNGTYTTCDLREPHFHIQARKIKMIPDKAIVTGPFNMYIGKNPTPLGFLFGIFPFTETRTSGIIVPVYGEAQDRGFFLREGGYYWAVNDKLALTFLGELYTNGSWGLNFSANYIKRYQYSGTAAFRFNNRIAGEDRERTVQQDFWFNWTHTPVPRGTSSFQASVAMGSQNFNVNNSFDTRSYLTNTFNSSVSYTKSFPGTPFNLTASANQDQNTRTGIANATLPQLSVAMQRIFPFKLLIKNNQKLPEWIRQIGISYNLNFQNQLTNAPTRSSFPFKTTQTVASDTLDFFEGFSKVLDNAQIGASHTIPISTTLKILKHFSLNPSFSYQEYWYPYRFDYTWDNTAQAVRVDTINNFSRAFVFSASANLTTRIYGTFRPRNSKTIEGIRHTMVPRIGFTYTPDFSEPQYDFYKKVQTDTAGNVQNVSRFLGFAVGGPGAGRSGNINFGIDNILEMKIRPRQDTAQPKKVSLLENLSITGNYNLFADSLNFSNLSLNARTRVGTFLDINAGATLDPYGVIRRSADNPADVLRVNRFAIDLGQGIARPTGFNLSVGAVLNPKSFNDLVKKKRETINNSDDQRIRNTLQSPEDYVDFQIPWSLRLSYIYTWSRQGFEVPAETQTLNFNGDVSLTKTWKIAITSGYDFKLQNIAFTTVDIIKDLHCWEMRFNWIPFGPRQSYNFEIYIKSSILRDLKISRRRSWYDRAAIQNGGLR